MAKYASALICPTKHPNLSSSVLPYLSIIKPLQQLRWGDSHMSSTIAWYIQLSPRTHKNRATKDNKQQYEGGIMSYVRNMIDGVRARVPSSGDYG